MTMKAKLIVEGREFPIEIHDPELQKLLTPQKKTGYERVGAGQTYWIQDVDDSTCWATEPTCYDKNNEDYDCANYYSSEIVAKNNARADKLMRQLRRFAVEHRGKDIDWNKENYKYMIRYNHVIPALCVGTEICGRNFGGIAFDTEESVKLAIDTFHDELIWYFTEYKDSL